MCTFNSVQLQLLHLVSKMNTKPEYTTIVYVRGTNTDTQDA